MIQPRAMRARSASGHAARHAAATTTTLATLSSLVVLCSLIAAGDSVLVCTPPTVTFGISLFTIKSNADAQALSGCTHINGSIALGGIFADVCTLQDISPLSSIVEIDGALAFNNCPTLADISPLGNLQRITGRETIFGSTLRMVGSTLTTLAPLTSLNAIEAGCILFSTNNNLVSIEILASVTSWNFRHNLTCIQIDNCDALQSLNGLQHVEEVSGAVIITSNAVLQQLSLTSLRNINGTVRYSTPLNSTTTFALAISDNPIIKSLSELSHLQFISGDVEVRGNDLLCYAPTTVSWSTIMTPGSYASFANNMLNSACAASVSSVIRASLSSIASVSSVLQISSATPVPGTGGPTLNNNNGGGASSSAAIGIGVGAAGGALLIAFIVILVLVRRRNERNKHNLSLPSQNGRGSTISNMSNVSNVSASAFELSGYPASNAYFAGADGKYYEIDVENAAAIDVTPLADLEVLPGDVTVNEKRMLGEGHFGQVFLGQHAGQAVAVKILKDPTHNVDTLRDFIGEALVMKPFAHPNVLRLVAVCTSAVPQMLVLEFMAEGDLKTLLRASRPELSTRRMDLTDKHLLQFVAQACTGLEYLHALRFIHRDIAARNLLVDSMLCVKIADFGLSRELIDSDYYRRAHKRALPVKFLALETLRDMIFDIRSDVWQMGVCIWEIFGYAEAPWPTVAPQDMKSVLTSGQRLERPAHCKDDAYGLLQSCWLANPDHRPTAGMLREAFQSMVDRA
ncbi:hypothetical protein CAOG_06420 [Capsaspora owczarzaki ATCC 30864]|uniref:TKL protein kinase n=1 Tax=Capsaspora owczarzaki (strain ATCC 30864) TaxID=595528 RepID=A0A0D2ULS8_CAPO3|nr:hypothetical protein CAOG_06420 [Capsaspora owczarzaki ATCC 30864]KJE96046.1 TKL protein kinase [Capsaspora owczarzaki ATCC 30864]|eukprot:XP_004345169.1 hypothetical protein CAOG_06420 [Capsaspora owczarzaki ATCC 30864]